MSVGAVRPLLRAAISLACIPVPVLSLPTRHSTRSGCVIPTSSTSSRVVFSTGKQSAASVAESGPAGLVLRRAAYCAVPKGHQRRRRLAGPQRARTAERLVHRSAGERQAAGRQLSFTEPNRRTLTPGQQHLVLLVGDAVADVVVEQVLAPDADGDLGHQAGLPVELGGVAELGVEQVVARGRRVEGGELVLRGRRAAGSRAPAS